MHLGAGRPEGCLNKSDRAWTCCNKISQALERPNCDRETRFLMDLSRSRRGSGCSKLVSGARGGALSDKIGTDASRYAFGATSRNSE
jgi:hypothetical protein